ncbi:unnamed protein product [Anisakis simplex]|uniref:Wiskott-Aldrich syndrome protein family member n=1 Tax=Anisakis simplex TaxID=6269 RepID=A0A0M3JT00_ANISI|nr:unnamed protein product [Anisakis simplex]
MPLIKRAISPVNVSLHRLPASVQTDELECVANGTLANLVRQLSSLSRHAEHIFGEIYHEAVKVDHKTNTMAQRIDRLTHKVTQLDCSQEQVSLEDLHMRKPFKSSALIDQHTLDRQTLPSALSECYAACDQPPNLDALNPYRDDKKGALKYYTDPSYFFDLWRQEMLKEMGDGRRAKAVKSPTDNKSPSRKKRNRQSASNDMMRQAPLSSRYVTATQQRTTDVMHFPAEYQAPQIVRMEQIQAPVGMSVPISNGYTSLHSTVITSPALNTASSTVMDAMNESRAVSDQLSRMQLEVESGSSATTAVNLLDVNVDVDDDDELPPPPPPLMHTSLVCQMPTPTTMQLVPPSQQTLSSTANATPPTATAASNQPQSQQQTNVQTVSSSNTVVVGSFANNANAVITSAATEAVNTKTTDDDDRTSSSEQQMTRSNLLAEIQSGIKLKQVQRKEQAAEEKAAAEANDVAAILRRRMEHVLGNSDTDSDSQSDDDEEWD